MPKVTIEETGCRGCTLCSDTCPVDVFEIDQEKNIAHVTHSDDCIGCLSCFYLCPSQCITIDECKAIKPFHRIEKDTTFVEKFLQTKTATTTISKDELKIAFGEIGLLLTSFSSAISEILGRGHKSVGRRAGTVAASHLPEMYEQKDLEALLNRMKARFGTSFDFEYTLQDNSIEISVQPCGLLFPVTKSGMEAGKADLCLLFHEYWAGLLSAFTKKKYSYEVKSAGDRCTVVFQS